MASAVNGNPSNPGESCSSNNTRWLEAFTPTCNDLGGILGLVAAHFRISVEVSWALGRGGSPARHGLAQSCLAGYLLPAAQSLARWV